MAILRPIYARDRRAFVAKLVKLDCYPCRVCYDSILLWIEFGEAPEDSWEEEDFG